MGREWFVPSPELGILPANGTCTELDRPKAEVMTRLRDSVSKTLVNEQWRYEPSDYMKALLVENHGRV